MRGWTNKFLSAVGKLVMLQSVLSAIPSYTMTCFSLPVSFCKRIQSAVTRYWWDHNENSTSMAWISWDSMAKPKALGGLGLRDFQNFNVSLLAKFSWRLLQNPHSLLEKVRFGKYCPDNNNILHATATSAISHGWRSVLLGRDLLVQNLGWVVGDGKNINVWDDPWLSLTNQHRPMGPPNVQHLGFSVSDFLLPATGDWDVAKIKRILPDFEEQILLIKPSLRGFLISLCG